MKVLIGLSGGVDSATSAALLKEAGHDVVAVTMNSRYPLREGEGLPIPTPGCYGPAGSDHLQMAEKVADFLGIEWHRVDLYEEFDAILLPYFRSEYLRGRTPIPCVMCNRHIKFGILLQKARQLDIEFEAFATGHYVRVVPHPDYGGVPLLHRPHHIEKDQSYFLHRIESQLISQAIFPLGELRKDQVRELARKMGLPVHDRSESTGFYAGDYRDLLAADRRKGEIVGGDGEPIGEHEGIWNYTIGQRRGLGTPQGVSRFVVELDASNNRVVTGGKSDLLADTILAEDLVWHVDPPAEGEERRLIVKAGNTAPFAQASVEASGRIRFDQPQIALAPGQAAVFYDGDFLLGGGWIAKIVRP